MSGRFTFPIAYIHRAKERAAVLARFDWSRIPDDMTCDPTPVLECFGCLRAATTRPTPGPTLPWAEMRSSITRPSTRRGDRG